MKERKALNLLLIFAEHLDGLERSDFGDFDKPRKRAYQKGKIEFNEQSKEESQPESIWGKSAGCQTESKAFVKSMLLLLLLFTRPLPRDGGMAEDHGAPEAGKLPRVWTRGHKETESRQRVSGAKSP